MKRGTFFVVAGIGIAIGLILGYLAFHKSGPDPGYWIERSIYANDVKARDRQIETALAVIADRDKLIAAKVIVIAEKDAKIAALKRTSVGQAAEGRELAAENVRLRTDVQAVIDANPAVKALIDNFDLRCVNYEKQIATLDLTLQETEQKVSILEDLGILITEERDVWHKQYDDEHALRLSCDSLRTHLEHDYKVSKFWAAVGKWAPPVTFGLGWLLGR